MGMGIHRIGMFNLLCSCHSLFEYGIVIQSLQTLLMSYEYSLSEKTNNKPCSWINSYKHISWKLKDPIALIGHFAISMYLVLMITTQSISLNAYSPTNFYYLGPRGELECLATSKELILPYYNFKILIVGPDIPNFLSTSHLLNFLSTKFYKCKYHELTFLTNHFILKPALFVSINSGFTIFESWLPTIISARNSASPYFVSDFCEFTLNLIIHFLNRIFPDVRISNLVLSSFRCPNHHFLPTNQRYLLSNGFCTIITW